MEPEPILAWYSVRCVFVLESIGEDDYTYEERITLWRSASAESAMESAEQEANDYAGAFHDKNSTMKYVGLAQCFRIADDLGIGVEIFSLMRDSALEPDEYITRFFDNGGERQMRIEE
ncbi:DUF4288 domain-containing protein [Demequina sp. SO4-13]|uniref:DUF4288 domain-containing protein n=1 Tax=Demequina sp. SO4-13 TaxID=3401027 RepID=UPI003AF873F6